VSTRYRPQMPVAAVSGSSVTATFLTEMNRYWFQPELPNMPLHLTAPGPARACPSRAVLSLTRACRR